MKPEVGGEGSMAQEEFDPLDMLSRVAMLVLEARTPHHSAKGRVEGPHCPGSSLQQGQHQCSQEAFECLRAFEFRQRLDHMWRNGIPSCIDVVLYPDCAHGWKEARSLEGAGSGVQEDCLLLERWNIMSIKKWHGEWTQGVPGSMLLRAVRSYLYFSQLSSWLASMHGCIPSSIACRLYAPGEEGGMSFQQAPQPHSFPLAVYGPHALKVAVTALPRQLSFPALLCALADPTPPPTTQRRLQAAREKGKRDVKVLEEKDEDTDKLKGAYGISTGTPQAKAAPASQCPVDTRQPPPVTCNTHTPDSTPQPDHQHQPKPSASASGGKGQGGEVKAERSASREALEGQLRPLELTPAAPQAYDLHSPKVLMSAGFHSTAPVTRRRQLDFSHPERLVQQDQPCVAARDQQLLLTASPVYSPLSPLDMQVFLANLQSIAAPIPAARLQAAEQTLGYQLKADKAGRRRGLGPVDVTGLAGPGFLRPQSQGMLDLAEPGDLQHSARFKKRKALPFGGDLPLPESADSMAVYRAEASSLAGVPRFAASEDLPLLPSGKSLESVLSKGDIRQLQTGEEVKRTVKSRALSKTDQDKVTSFTSSHELGSSTPVSIFPDISLSIPSQHSMQQTISQTLRDLGKIVRASEAVPCLGEAQSSSHQPKVVEAVPASSPSSSSSSSSTYSSSPVVAAEDGGRHSDSSTPTNLSFSPTPDDSQSVACHTSEDSRVDPLCPEPSSVMSNGTTVSVTQRTPLGGAGSVEGSTEHSVALGEESSAVTPETCDRAFKDTAVKRRLHMDPCSLRSDKDETTKVQLDAWQAEKAREGKKSMEDARHSTYCGKEITGAECSEGNTPTWGLPKPSVGEAINLNVPPIQRPTLQQFVEHHNHLNLSAPEQSHTPSHGLPTTHSSSSHCDFHQATHQHPQSIRKADIFSEAFYQREHVTDTSVDDCYLSEHTCDKKSPCSFYLESPTSPQAGRRRGVLPQNASVKPWGDVDWLTSSVRALSLQDKADQSTWSDGHTSQSTDDSTQSQSNGFLQSDTTRGSSVASGFVRNDSAEDTSLSNGVAVKDTSLSNGVAVKDTSLSNRVVVEDTSLSNGVADSKQCGKAVELEVDSHCAEPRSFKDSATRTDSPPHFQCHTQTSAARPVSGGHVDAKPTPSLSDSSHHDSSSKENLFTQTSQGNLEKHRQCRPEDSVTTPPSSKPSQRDASPVSACANGTLDHKASACRDSGADEDSVFYDKENQGEPGSSAHCPTRTKSAPSFSTLSAKCTVGNDDNYSPDEVTRGRSALRDKDGKNVAGPDRLRHRLVKSASMMFNARGTLPSQSSPAPVKRRSTGRFDYDETLTTTKAIKSAISMSRLADVSKESSDKLSDSGRVLSTSAPATTNCLLGNFEESILNGRLEPAGVVDGFSIDIGASGSFCPRHLSLPVTAYFFNLSDDNAPSPYLGHINLEGVGKRGYHIPNKGTLQVTLFNPNKTVVKMFVVLYDLEDMPPNCQTVIRQRTVYIPADPDSDLPSYLRYLIHLRVCSSASGKIYLHTDVRLIFARNKFELDSTVAQYQLRSFTETPVNPKYSPKR